MLAVKAITGEYPVWFSVRRGDLGKDFDSGTLCAAEAVSPAMQKIIRVKVCSDLKICACPGTGTASQCVVQWMPVSFACSLK